MESLSQRGLIRSSLDLRWCGGARLWCSDLVPIRTITPMVRSGDRSASSSPTLWFYWAILLTSIRPICSVSERRIVDSGNSSTSPHSFVGFRFWRPGMTMTTARMIRWARSQGDPIHDKHSPNTMHWDRSGTTRAAGFTRSIDWAPSSCSSWIRAGMARRSLLLSMQIVRPCSVLLSGSG